MNTIQKQTNQNLTIFFYLTHVKREETESLIQFLQKFHLKFRRIRNEKQVQPSDYLRKNSNFLAQSSKPISFEEFQTISQFLNTQTIVVGFEYGNVIWNISRTKMQPKMTLLHSNKHATWNLLQSIAF